MPLELKTKKELAQYAHTLARGFNLVRYRSTTYMPADFETGDTSVTPAPERCMWIPLHREAIRRQASNQFDVLFSSESELASFDFMVAQNSQSIDTPIRTLLVRTEHGLRELRDDGQLHEPSGEFVPNTLVPMLNENQADKDRVFEVISQWVDSDEEAHALIRHLATALAPGWSAVKYVLLLGEGRNGKSLLLKMLHDVFGFNNVSNVTRQHIAEQSPVVCELNGKLVNIVFDGRAEYVKDSGLEKSLIAGEQVSIRRLYESTPTPVQTNALFIEGLNREPKSTDKSLALQKRLIRFQFPNVYALDHKFERRMLAHDSLGALLALMIEHYVTEDEVAKALAPSARAWELQLEHMFTNSLGLQFLKYLEEHDNLGAEGIVGDQLSLLTAKFQAWRLKENDMNGWAEPDVVALFQPIINTDRQSIRVDGKPRKVRVVSSLKAEALAYLETLKGDEEDVHSDDQG